MLSLRVTALCQSQPETSTEQRGLTQLEGNGVFDHREYVSEVSANASGEFALEQSLEQAGRARLQGPWCVRLSVAARDEGFGQIRTVGYIEVSETCAN